MEVFVSPVLWILAAVLILSSLGVILVKRPVYASLSFLLTLLTLAAFYLQLSAEFIGVMQVLVYAGAILVLFMFVIVLFQDAHQQIANYEAQSSPTLLIIASIAFLVALAFIGKEIIGLSVQKAELPPGYGTVESLGQALYVDFFFPFEAVVLLFLAAVIGALYIGKKTG